ncbi:MAG: hypothetical protein Ct9H300mP32_2000 [Verrucomicrobiota bacterium]|nr:MAG: hypothetical protein Ct9H300mP32_2000 [Verrucomicrobiota bacterium]
MKNSQRTTLGFTAGSDDNRAATFILVRRWVCIFNARIEWVRATRPRQISPAGATGYRHRRIAGRGIVTSGLVGVHEVTLTTQLGSRSTGSLARTARRWSMPKRRSFRIDEAQARPKRARRSPEKPEVTQATLIPGVPQRSFAGATYRHGGWTWQMPTTRTSTSIR